MSLGKGESRQRKQQKWHRKDSLQSKKWCSSHKFFYVLFSVTQFFLGVSWSSHNITASNKKNTSKKEPIIVFEITIQYLHKNTIIPLLCKCGLFIHTCVSKNAIVSKDGLSTSFNITWFAETAIYAKNILFSHSIDSYF